MRPISLGHLNSRRLLALFTAFLQAALLASFATRVPTAEGGSWPPIDPEDLALKQGRVDAEADAEAIDWEIVISDDLSGGVIRSSQTQHLRIKIFSARGRDAQSRIDIPYSSDTEISDIAGRTIRPDGSIVELKKDAILERTILKGGGLKVKAKTMAMPAVEPGCIIEYRWTSVQYDRLTNYVKVELQRDIPAERLRFSIHPLLIPDSPFQMRLRSFNFTLPPFSEDAGGFHTMEISNTPALKTEPYMPPGGQLRPWIAIFYAEDAEPEASQFWRDFGKSAWESSRSLSRTSGDVKRATASAVGDATFADQKVERIAAFCRARLRNADLSDSGLTADDRKWLKSEHTASDYLKRGLADGRGVLRLFLSMTAAAGIDARLALLPDRSDCIFDPKIPAWYLLTRSCAAVQIQGAWRTFVPEASDLPLSMIPWWVEGVDMLVPDPETSTFVRTPIAPPEQSLTRKSARLKLSEDGTVEGDVTEEFTGHEGAGLRQEYRDHSAVEREKIFKDEIKARMSTAEASDIRIDAGSDPSTQPFTIAYHIRVPGYAQRTGQRLFLQPAFFQRGSPPVFPDRERKYPIHFSHPWAESDMVVFELPEGFRAEGPSELKPIHLPKIGMQSVRVRLSDDGRQIQFLRSLLFGENGTICFPAEEYARLRDAFDRFHEQDETLLSLIADEGTTH